MVRELKEELGIDIDEERMIHLGEFSAPAANELGATVKAILFLIDSIDNPSANAEIEELIWVHPAGASDLMLAPLTKKFVMPLVSELKSSAW